MIGLAFVIVLASVAALVLVICLFMFLNRKSDSSTPDNNQPSANLAATPGRTKKNNSNIPDDDALVAVLTAAVLASMGNRPDIKIRVTSFRRVPETSPIWNTVGRKEYISNKL